MARPHPRPVLRAAVLLLVVGAVLGGCGRRGRLEPPPTPESIAAAEKARDSKSGLHKRPSNPPIRPPNQPFLLDPLL